MTRLETGLLASVLLVVVLAGITFLVRTYSTALTQTEHATVPDGQPFEDEVQADEPVAVSVVAAGTVALPPDAASDSGEDGCDNLAGVQSATFDCSLPAYVPALDLAASSVKGRYQCADRAHYQLVGGQAVEPDKQCVLKSVARANRR